MKKKLGSFDAFLRYRGLNSKKIFFWGVSITPNFLPRGESNRQYFSSAENLKRICIKHSLQMMALSVLILEFAGGRTFQFFSENLWPRSFAFETNFRRIYFPINLFIIAQWRALSKFKIIFLMWRSGPKKIWDPLISPQFKIFSAFFVRKRPRSPPSVQNVTVLSLTGDSREPI